MKTFFVEKKSPFAIFNESERLVNVKSSYKTSMYITELDKTILMAINSGLVTTSALLFRLLKSRDDVIDQNTIKQRLNKLWKAEYIEKYQYVNDDGTYSANKAYILSYRARGLLKSIAIKPNKTQYIQSLIDTEPTQIKRLLSAQQFAISFGEDFKIAETVLVPRIGKAKYIFRPHATIEADCGTIFVDSVRSGELDRIIDKIHRISDVCKHKTKANICITNPMVVLVCEDKTHEDQIKAALETKLSKSHLQIMVTNDLDVYSGDGVLTNLNLQKTYSFLDLFFERKVS